MAFKPGKKVAYILMALIVTVTSNVHAGVFKDLFDASKKLVSGRHVEKNERQCHSVLSPDRASLPPLKTPQLESPTKLERGLADPNYSAVGANAAWSHREFLTAEKNELHKVMWRSLPRGEFAARNGMRIVAARIFEAFGYQTSQPRIAWVDGEKRVLEKVMDQWRTFQGEKIKPYARLDKDYLDTSEFRQLRLVAILVKSPFILDGNIGGAGDQFFLSSLRTDLSAMSETKSDLAAILKEVPVEWLSTLHPWRVALEDSDVLAFQEKLRGLSDNLIQKIVASAELEDASLERQLIEELKRRRDLLLQPWSAHDLPGRPSHELEQAVRALPPELQGSAPFGIFSDRDKADEFNKTRLSHVEQMESVVRAYIRGESSARDEVYYAFDHLKSLPAETGYVFPTELWVQTFRRTVELLSGPEIARRKDVQTFGEKILKNALAQKPASQELLRALMGELVQAYHQHPATLEEIFQQAWYFPEDESSTRGFADFDSFVQTTQQFGLSQFTEILLSSLISAALSQAEWADHALSKGGGYHNAQRVSGAMNYALHGIQVFKQAQIPASEITRGLDLDRLSEILSALRYEGGSGKRLLGPIVTPAQAFGLDGARRQETYNVYDLVRAYIWKQLSNLPPIGPS